MFIAGVIGAAAAGWASDHFFDARRGPTVALLYGLATTAAVGMFLTIAGMPTQTCLFGIIIVMTAFGVHGLLSGTATADFGGENTGVVTGIVDGMVYLAVGFQFWFVGHFIAPAGAAKAISGNWDMWPVFQGVFAVAATLLAIKIWNEKPKPKTAPATAEPAEV